MNRRLFLTGIFALVPANLLADRAGPSRPRTVTYQVAWGPLYPEFKTSPYDHMDRYGVYVREQDRIIRVRFDQVVSYGFR